MASCKRCGKKMLLPTMISGSYCPKCKKEIEAEQKKREHEQQMAAFHLEQEQLSNALQYFNELVDTYKKAHVSTAHSSIDTLMQAKNNCIRCMEMLQKLPTIPEMDTILFQALSVVSQRVPLYQLQGIGQVDLNSDKSQIILDRPYRELQDLEKTYESLMENSIQFESYINSLQAVSIIPVSPIQPFEYLSDSFPSFQTRNITVRTPISSLNNFIALDTETTGLSPLDDEIIQISAIRFVNFTPVSCFSTYVKPRKGLKSAATRVNHITDDQIADAPYFEQIHDALLDYLGENIPLVGHRISFDLNFLISSGIMPSKISSRKIFDTLDLAKHEFPAEHSYSLDYLCQHVLNISREDAHNSLSDALISGMLFEKICRRRMKF